MSGVKTEATFDQIHLKHTQFLPLKDHPKTAACATLNFGCFAFLPLSETIYFAFPGLSQEGILQKAKQVIKYY